MEPEPSRKVLRDRLLALRAAAAGDAARLAALQARVAAWLAPLTETCLALYWPFRGEPDLRSVASAWASANASPAEAQRPARHCALPVIHDRLLRFAPWQAGAPMVDGAFGIPIPAAAATLQPDLLLIPCVGFDPAGVRLGYGGGYYDRTLAAWTGARPLTVGIAFEATRVADLQPHAGDVPLDLILTERADYGRAAHRR